MLKEFKEFAMRGNVIDLAIGIILGTAFGKIVSSMVGDVLMPPLGLVLGKVNFSQLFLNLGREPFATLAEAQAAGAPTLNYGLFIQSVVDFTAVSFAVFLMVKGINAAKRREAEKPAPPPGPTPDQKLLAEIRDLLSARR